ncbi:MAG: preprotein translocase subunit SecG [Bacillota bacterium]|nr:preprotein translocase subunit SecG [Bacillota bacterium]
MALFAVSCIVLIVSVLMQSGKSAGMSGIIGGGAEQLFGKQKGRSMDALFEKLTKISAVAFMVIAVLLLIIRRFF